MISFLICLTIKKINLIITGLFIRSRKLNIYHTILFCCTKNIRLSTTHDFIMKVPNGRQLQQIVFNHSSDVGFEEFMNLYKKCITKSNSFSVIDATLSSDNPFWFRKILLERIQKIIMTTVNKEAAKISAPSSEKIDKDEYLTDKE